MRDKKKGETRRETKKNREMRCKTKKNGKTRPGQKKMGRQDARQKNGETRCETEKNGETSQETIKKMGRRDTIQKEKVAQRHQMVSGSLALLFFLLGFHGGRQGSGPDRGGSPVEWGDFPSVRLSVRPSVPPSGPST